ncbi:MAG TPA: bacillithiol biosynthesis cysteine-adding enzyme BshC [Ohtaekwangia sp.]|uniref:bacillithiol biosynthesis cysteine-adding enzyme BshC n=1 Tax=Ohtaekwangia sp. TaxID=2066019 RepID=UPI002F953BB6
MKLNKLSFADTRAFSSFFLDYIEQKETLKPFYNRFPQTENFAAQLADKSQAFPQQNRDILADVLVQQYTSVPVKQAVQQNIAALRDTKTFTVITGHQLNIFTGPLYFIYKIVTVINACKQLKKQYPEYTFVPVYWMASEDHDYDEIKYFKLYGKKYTWQTEQTGAVGRFSTQDIKSLLQEVPGDTRIFQEAYTKNKTLADAVRHYVNTLFGDEGLAVVDADNATLKSLFKKVIHQDIFENISKKFVDKTNEALQQKGYHTQVYCRDINFFYLDKNLRSRIEKSGDDTWKVLDTDISFSSAELKKLIEEQPERFSPNVILRPLYQEVILPNLAYVGGPAEVVYWLQLKGVFDHFKVPFPMLMPRNFAMVMEHTVTRKFEKTGLELKDLFEDKNYIFNHWVLEHSTHNLTVGPERTQVHELFEELKKRSDAIDKTLTAYISAEGKRALNSLEKIERKLLRAEKRLHKDKLGQIEAVKDALFPNGSLQERTDNFLNFYQRDSNFIQRLYEQFDPFDYKFNVLSYTADL